MQKVYEFFEGTQNSTVNIFTQIIKYGHILVIQWLAPGYTGDISYAMCENKCKSRSYSKFKYLQI